MEILILNTTPAVDRETQEKGEEEEEEEMNHQRQYFESSRIVHSMHTVLPALLRL
jgi:hypothetical protein